MFPTSSASILVRPIRVCVVEDLQQLFPIEYRRESDAIKPMTPIYTFIRRKRGDYRT